MNIPSRFKNGARDAWTFIQRGHDTETMGRLACTDPADQYCLGWQAQCDDPDRELHPPDYKEPDDGDVYVGILIAVALLAFAAFAILAFCGIGKAAVACFAVALLTVFRISKI